jgi:predicted dithiol-disulfide oxidoreductase (DUF899 family)
MNKKKDMKIPKVVSPQEWEAARQQLLVKGKALTRARDTLAAERRRMPWLAVEKEYENPFCSRQRKNFTPDHGWIDDVVGAFSLAAGTNAP